MMPMSSTRAALSFETFGMSISFVMDEKSGRCDHLLARDATEHRTLCLDSLSMRARPYPVRRQAPRDTRKRIIGAVRALLEEGTFHESTVEEVAARAGVARATLYQHF